MKVPLLDLSRAVRLDQGRDRRGAGRGRRFPAFHPRRGGGGVRGRHRPIHGKRLRSRRLVGNRRAPRRPHGRGHRPRGRSRHHPLLLLRHRGRDRPGRSHARIRGYRSGHPQPGSRAGGRQRHEEDTRHHSGAHLRANGRHGPDHGDRPVARSGGDRGRGPGDRGGARGKACRIHRGLRMLLLLPVQESGVFRRRRNGRHERRRPGGTRQGPACARRGREIPLPGRGRELPP